MYNRQRVRVAPTLLSSLRYDTRVYATTVGGVEKNRQAHGSTRETAQNREYRDTAYNTKYTFHGKTGHLTGLLPLGAREHAHLATKRARRGVLAVGTLYKESSICHHDGLLCDRFWNKDRSTKIGL